MIDTTHIQPNDGWRKPNAYQLHASLNDATKIITTLLATDFLFKKENFDIDSLKRDLSSLKERITVLLQDPESSDLNEVEVLGICQQVQIIENTFYEHLPVPIFVSETPHLYVISQL